MIQKCKNPPNVREAQPIEDFWSILKGKVYEDYWKADNLTLLKNRIRVCLRHINHNLVYRFLDSMKFE